MKKEVSPAIMVAVVLVVVVIVAFFGWRALRPPQAIADTESKAPVQATQQINGTNVPNNVPSFYYTEHQGGNNTAPAPSQPGRP